MVDKALADVADDTCTGVVGAVPAFTWDAVGAVDPLVKMIQRTFSTRVTVKEATVVVPVTVVADGWTVNPDVYLLRSESMRKGRKKRETKTYQ